MEKFDKEFLNADKCMEDMKYWLKGEALAYLTDILLLSFLCFPFTLPALVVPSVATILLAVCFWLIPFAYLVKAACLLIPNAIRISGRKYAIVEDTLSGTNVVEKKTRGGWHIEWRFLMFRAWLAWLTRNQYYRYLFYFEGHGEYTAKYITTQRVSRGDNFVWSRSFRMGDAALANNSHSGELFYLLTYETGRTKKETKIAFIYPKKFFEWQDENV